MPEITTPLSAREWWEKNQSGYPFQLILEPGSGVNPVDVQRILGHEHQFIFVAFDSRQHWGFAEAEGRAAFIETFNVQVPHAQPK